MSTSKVFRAEGETKSNTPKQQQQKQKTKQNKNKNKNKNKKTPIVLVQHGSLAHRQTADRQVVIVKGRKLLELGFASSSLSPSNE